MLDERTVRGKRQNQVIPDDQIRAGFLAHRASHLLGRLHSDLPLQDQGFELLPSPDLIEGGPKALVEAADAVLGEGDLPFVFSHRKGVALRTRS